MTASAVQPAERARLAPARLGVWLFLVSEAMFFAGLIAAFLVLREGSSAFGGPAGRLSLPLMTSATLMLILSSLCVSRATVAWRNRREARIVASWTRRAILFGTLFLALQAVEWRECLRSGIAPRTSLYWSSFFVLTGAHALHVAGGLVWLSWAWNSARAGVGRLRLELAEIYWHFVGLVWIVLFALLYTT
jgi:heme/copper-type cytochrome/quinol oxidase subunit 3